MKITDMPSFTIRIEPDLRDRLAREAFANGRSLSQETAMRIKASFEAEEPTALRKPAQVVHTAEPGAAFQQPQPTDSQRMLLALFDALTPDRQLALLTLLAPVKR